jgi:uncharacterized iron-regulated membrane protein
MAVEPEIGHLWHWKLSYVTPQARTLSLAEIGSAVSKAFPGERIVDYGISTSPRLSYQVGLQSGSVYVDQYTGQVLGTRSEPDFVDVLQNDIHQLHLRLLVTPKGRGVDPGKTIMSWAGVAMLFLLVSGLYLWWPLKRVRIRSEGPARRFWFDLHNTVGILSLGFLLVLTITGAIIGFDDKTIPWFYRITQSEPSRPPRIMLIPPSGAKPITPDEALEIARATLPGALPFGVNVPGPKGAYQIRMRFPEDRTPGGRSVVMVDQYNGKVLFAEGSRTAPGGRRLEIANRAIHTGDIFGIPSKIVMSLASLMAAAQLVSGAAMWWKRMWWERRKRPAADSTPTARSLGIHN